MARHFSYFKNSYESRKRFEAVYEASKLRTYLSLPVENYYWSRTSSKMINEMLCRFKCLRVLSFTGCRNFFQLPDSISNLKHLRYLDLSGTEVKTLPNSMCSLYNLQILKLVGCWDLEELPPDMHKLINLRHLDFRGTKVRKLPMGLMKVLKNLRVLTSFFVGKCGEFKINQLAELNLRGALSIEDLQNVTQPVDASAANLKKKIHLERLSLGWSMEGHGSQNEREVLEKLQPHANLKDLSIENYGGTRFADWFEDNSLSNIVSLQLRNCKYCLLLPPLGILPSLKELSIEGLDGIVNIGPEFYGNNSSTAAPFRSVRVLKIEAMAELEKWECRNALGAFPCLETLAIENCSKLKEQLPEQLPSLLKLELRGCKQLVASLPSAPAVPELALRDCGNLQWESPPAALKTLHISGLCMEVSLLKKIEHTIANTCVESLGVYHCPNMEFPIAHSHPFLREVRIIGCDSLRAFPIDFFPKLQQLELDGCSNLERLSISEEGHDLNLTSLTNFRIKRCPKFVSFPRGGFSAPILQWCSIAVMESFKSLPEGMHIRFPSLEVLHLYACPQLESFPEGGLPSNLKKLVIYGCPSLIASRMTWDLHGHASLNDLLIGDASVDSLPDQGLLPPTLGSLHLDSCSNLKTLDYRGLCHLSSLKELSIYYCPRLQCLPKEGLPSSLSTLEIHRCPLLKQRCRKERGDDWTKIAHIPCVEIDGDIIT